MLAMQDAMEESKFQLMLKLLNKTSNTNIIKRKNDKGQNLIHILAQNAKGLNLSHILDQNTKNA